MKQIDQIEYSKLLCGLTDPTTDNYHHAESVSITHHEDSKLLMVTHYSDGRCDYYKDTVNYEMLNRKD